MARSEVGKGSSAAARVWPTGTDYTRSIQTPGVAFTDGELAAGRPGVNAMGMPLVASGQNAVVFLLETERGRQAVRCFLTPPHEGAVRYAALEEHLGGDAPAALTAARWLRLGISVSGESWPVVVMPWVEGAPLNIAVEDMLDEPVRLRSLAEQWADTVRELQRARVAHGDLQHGNVLVKPGGAIALVDLDGVWVPEIKVGPPAEFGHPNYQHPQRTTAHWGQYVDSFPGALIELALLGLAADSSLDRFLHGENLLFMRSDLERPGDSEVWGALCSSPDPKVAGLAALLRQRCAGPIANVLIPFDDLRDGELTAPVEAIASTPVPPRPASLLPAAADPPNPEVVESEPVASTLAAMQGKPTKWPVSAKVAAALLSVAAVGFAIFGLATMSSLNGQLDDKQAEIESAQEAFGALEQQSGEQAATLAQQIDTLTAERDDLDDEVDQLRRELRDVSGEFLVPAGEIRPVEGRYSGTFTGSNCKGWTNNAETCANYGGVMEIEITDDGQAVAFGLSDLAVVPLGSFDGLVYTGSAAGTGYFARCGNVDYTSTNVMVTMTPVEFTADPSTELVSAVSYIVSVTINWPKTDCYALTLTLGGVVSAD